MPIKRELNLKESVQRWQCKLVGTTLDINYCNGHFLLNTGGEHNKHCINVSECGRS